MDGTAVWPRGQMVVAVSTTTTILAFISICARLYTRHFISHQLGIDDFMAVAALVYLATIAASATQSINAARFLTQPAANVDWEDNFVSYLFVFWLNDVMYNTAFLFVKMTFLFQYFRVFRKVYYMWIAYIIAIVLIGCWCMAQILMIIFACSPVQASWEFLPNAKCWMPESFVYINAGGTIVTDLVVLFLPLPTIWNLKLRRSQKWGLVGIFGIGGIVPIISILRITALVGPFPDDIIKSDCWSIAELCAGIITASLATISLLFSSNVPTFGPRAHELSIKHRMNTGRQNSAGSQRDLFEQDELDTRNGSISNDSEDRKDAEHQAQESTSAGYLNNKPGIQLQEATDSLHFGLPRYLRTGTKTKITSEPSHGQSMSAGGAEFLNTFGIRVERDWVISESAAPGESK